MKSFVPKLFLTIIIGLFASSCANTKYIVIDVAQPATISFAKEVVTIAIVDNAGLVLSDSIVDETTTASQLQTSISKESLKKSLIARMNEEEYFHKVSLYPTFIRTDKNYGEQLPLRKNEVKTIAKEMDADAVISLDVFDTKTKNALYNMDGFLFKTNMVVSNMLFRVYDYEGNSIAPTMAASDSIVWFSDMKNESQVFSEMGEVMADGMVKQLMPYWVTQERAYYIDGTKEMKEADKQVQLGHWTEAANLWGEAFDKQQDEKQKAKIAVNIALANENLGDIENAVEWIRVASKIIDATKSRGDEYNYINWYKIRLLERERDNPKVLKQLGVEEDNEQEE